MALYGERVQTSPAPPTCICRESAGRPHFPRGTKRPIRIDISRNITLFLLICQHRGGVSLAQENGPAVDDRRVRGGRGAVTREHVRPKNTSPAGGGGRLPRSIARGRAGLLR